MIKAVLFDLDGTLLPMDQDEFTNGYFRLLAKKAIPYGYETKKLVDTVWAGTAEMVKNNGVRNNEEVFWRKFAEFYGEDKLSDKALFDEFYQVEFNEAKHFCGFAPKAAEIIKKIHEAGLCTVLATNPIFPETATLSRMKWAGVKPEDFAFFTHYGNIGFSKPNPKYYIEIAERIGVSPEECLMVGNDVTEDMIAETVGMKVFLLTDCLINKENKDISRYPNGGFDELFVFVDKLMCMSL